jgi:hypothetical protein
MLITASSIEHFQVQQCSHTKSLAFHGAMAGRTRAGVSACVLIQHAICIHKSSMVTSFRRDHRSLLLCYIYMHTS